MSIVPHPCAVFRLHTTSWKVRLGKGQLVHPSVSRQNPRLMGYEPSQSFKFGTFSNDSFGRCLCKSPRTICCQHKVWWKDEIITQTIFLKMCFLGEQQACKVWSSGNCLEPAALWTGPPPAPRCYSSCPQEQCSWCLQTSVIWFLHGMWQHHCYKGAQRHPEILGAGVPGIAILISLGRKPKKPRGTVYLYQTVIAEPASNLHCIRLLFIRLK